MHEHAGTTAAAALIDAAIAGHVCSAAAAEIGATSGVIWRRAAGTLSFADDAAAAAEDTIFDLASLTKPIATSSVVMTLVTGGRAALDELVSFSLEEWTGDDRRTVTLRDLLEHASGLPARLVDAPPEGRREFEHEICRIPLEYPPRTRSVYSDLGFILLGFIASDRAGEPLDRLFGRAAVTALTAAGERTGGPDAPVLGFRVPPGAVARTAVTRPFDDDHRRGRTLRGEVHDSYAARLGGVAGHAGLFGCVRAVGAFARAVLGGVRGRPMPEPFSAATAGTAIRRSAVPGSSRALGWDTMLPTSSCGSKMSPQAFGHVGFTGTSLWIDPVRDRYYVLLTNRVAGPGTPDEMAGLRRTFHEALAEV
jgi:CubicO group peptidase (beta-lactamase class C family)